MEYLLLARKYWKLAALGLLCLLLAVQSVRLGHAKNETERVKIANNELRGELKRISDAKDRQGETTKGNMEKVENGRKRSETIARRIEGAPLPGNCATPKEILEADL